MRRETGYSLKIFIRRLGGVWHTRASDSNGSAEDYHMPQRKDGFSNLPSEVVGNKESNIVTMLVIAQVRGWGRLPGHRWHSW
eukprot:12351513-Alexandrium_andersonii.AAC.1